MSTYTVTLRDPPAAEDTPSDESVSFSEQSGPIVERESPTAFSTSSASTLLPSDVEDVMLLDHEDQIKNKKLDEDYMLIEIMVDVEACTEPSTEPTCHKFLDLPRKLQIAIFREIIPTGQCYKPFYKAGMLKGYLVNSGWSVTTEPVTDEETRINFVTGDNYDFYKSALVNKEYADVYLETFYSGNGFAFDDPQASLWFLKNIGNNLSHLRNLQLVLHSGFPSNTRNVHRDDILTNQSLEELWYSVLCFLQYRHKLEKLTIAIFKWPTETEMYRKRFCKDDIDEIVKYRKLIYHKLERIHGIKKVVIKDVSYSLTDSVPGGNMAQLTLHMQQFWPAKKPVDKRKTPLAEVLKASRKRLDVATEDDMETGDGHNDVYRTSKTARVTRINSGGSTNLSQEDVKLVVDDMVAGTTDKSKGRALQLIERVSHDKSIASGDDEKSDSVSSLLSTTPESGLLNYLLTSIDGASAANNQRGSTSSDDTYRSSSNDSYRPSNSGSPNRNQDGHTVHLGPWRRSGSSFGPGRNRPRTYGNGRRTIHKMWDDDDNEQPKRE